MKITRKQLLNLIKEALNADDLLNQQGEWRVMSNADARQRYEDYVLSQGDYIDGGLFDPENESLYDSFIEWMKLHPSEFSDELSKLESGEDPMVDYAAQKSKGDNDPDTNDDGMLSVGELEKMTQDIAADLREGSVKITRRQLRQIISETADQYAQGMAQQRAVAKKASFPAADEVIDGLLRVVGNDGSFETQEARDAILALQDVESADELMSSLADVEGYIADALRARIQGQS